MLRLGGHTAGSQRQGIPEGNVPTEQHGLPAVTTREMTVVDRGGADAHHFKISSVQHDTKRQELPLGKEPADEKSMQRTANANARGVNSMQSMHYAQANKSEGIAAGRAIVGHIKGSGHAAMFLPTHDAVHPLARNFSNEALTKKDALEAGHMLTKENALGSTIRSGPPTR